MPTGPLVTPTFSSPSQSAALSAPSSAPATSDTSPSSTSSDRPLSKISKLLPSESLSSATRTASSHNAAVQFDNQIEGNQASETQEPSLSNDTLSASQIAQLNQSQEREIPDILISPSVVPEQASPSEESGSDDELGELRLQLERSRQNESEEDDFIDELGELRTRQTARAEAEAEKQPTAFLSGRLGYFDTDNAFRIRNPIDGPTVDNQIYQAGLSFLFFPKLSQTTSLYLIAETNLARYGDNEVQLTRIDQNTGEAVPLIGRDGNQIAPIRPNYNEVELQVGLRQKLFPRTYARLGWRKQLLFDEGYRERKFTANYIDAQLSHRAILDSRTWLDGLYQARIGFTSSPRADRFRQTFTLSLNHQMSQDLRTSLLYQLDFADYTRSNRFDSYQQVLGLLSYNLTPESRVSLFGGTRFGRSSRSDITLDDTFYGASLNVTVPLF